MNKLTRQLLPFATLLLIIIILSLLQPHTFLTLQNFLNVLRRSSVYGIIAVGMTFVIVSGGIDLSVGSMLALAAMIAARTMLALAGPEPSPAVMCLGVIIGILTGTACGFLNGLAITRLRLQPFIVTLGAMSLFRGLSLVMNQGQPYNVPYFRYLGQGRILGLPISVLIFALVLAAAVVTLAYTRFGRYTYALGSNREAAFHAGVNVNRNLTAIYTLAGALTGLAAMIAMSRTVSAQPTAGLGAELEVIAAVVIGGASLSGGRGTVIGTLIGALLINFLKNGCTLIGISDHAQLIVIGLIIVLAVTVDQFTTNKSRTTQP